MMKSEGPFFFGETTKTREEIFTTFKKPSAVFACPAEPTMLLPGLLGLMLLRSERQNFADILVENDERTTKNSAASQAYSSLRNTANSHRLAFNFLDSEERMFLVHSTFSNVHYKLFRGHYKLPADNYAFGMIREPARTI
ncbi:uncharacterized protein ZBAI_07606 [Zygosaccharomyces bailii ISA1307]|nr:uncharacterized protein ZBAI_07606 [Zygosaccharomyces bailii ISA1307]